MPFSRTKNWPVPPDKVELVPAYLKQLYRALTEEASQRLSDPMIMGDVGPLTIHQTSELPGVGTSAEKITNGGFDSSLSGWTINEAGTLNGDEAEYTAWTPGVDGWVWSGGKAYHAAGNTSSLSQSFSVTSNGEPHLISFVVSGLGVGQYLLISTESGTPFWSPVLQWIVADGTYSIYYATPGSFLGTITIRFAPYNNSATCSIDNVSIKLLSIPAPVGLLFNDYSGTYLSGIRYLPDIGGNGVDSWFMGDSSGRWMSNASNSSSSGNVFIGGHSGLDAVPGGKDYATQGNIAIGFRTGERLHGGAHNVIIGAASGAAITGGSSNVCIGGGSGHHLKLESSNVFLGTNAGIFNHGSRGILLGFSAGSNLTTESDRLVIDSHGTSRADSAEVAAESIIYGAMDDLPKNQSLTINANVHAGYGDADFDTDDVLVTTITNTDGGEVIVYASVDGVSAIYKIQAGTIAAVSADAAYTNTKDTAGTYNVYFETNVLRCQNKVGDNKNIKIAFYGV